MRTFAPSFVSSFLRARRRSDSFILRFEMFVMRVVPGVSAERTANVMTRSGVSFMSASPSDFRFFGPVMVILFPV